MPVINQVVKKFHLNPIDNDRLILLCGFNHENIKKIEITFDVIINNRSNHFKVSGQVEENVEIAISLIIKLYELTESGHLDSDQIEMLLNCPQSIDDIFFYVELLRALIHPLHVVLKNDVCHLHFPLFAIAQMRQYSLLSQLQLYPHVLSQDRRLV